MNRNVPLIVVDVQNGFVTPKSQHVLSAVSDLTAAWISAGRPVFMTRFINTPGSSWQSLMGWQRLQGEPETALHPTLDAYLPSVTVVNKTSYTSVTGSIKRYLEKTRPPAVAICGIATDGCVLKTALDVFDMGLRPLVIADACATHAGIEVHEAAMMILTRQLGREQIVHCNEMLAARPAA